MTPDCPGEAGDPGEEAGMRAYIKAKKCYGAVRGVRQATVGLTECSTWFYFGGCGLRERQEVKLKSCSVPSEQRCGGIRWPGLVGNCESFGMAAAQQ